VDREVRIGRRRIADMAVGIGVVVLIGGVLWLIGRGGYPGGPDECIAQGDCYCEAIPAVCAVTGPDCEAGGSGWVAQPINAWSNAGFVLVGLVILGGVGVAGESSLMARSTSVRRLYGAVAIFLGVGSFLFHGTMRAWGGYLDLLSMHAFIALLLAYDVARLRGGGPRAVWAAFWPALTIFGVVLVFLPPEDGKFVFAVLVVVTLGVESMVGTSKRILVHRLPWFWGGLGAFAVAVAVWVASKTGGPWCDPQGLVQGHALWHLLTAVTVWCLYRYLLADERRGVADGAEPIVPDRTPGAGVQ
jgi:hypothetical protein